MHTQGPVPLDDQSYIERNFELQLVKEVQAGKWVLLLGPRQHGKTSALLRLREKLSKHSTATALVDLQRAPPFTSYSQLVTWFGKRVAAELEHATEIAEVDDLLMALSAALPPGNTPVVVLVDEASNIGDDNWRNSFYGQLRSIANDRAIAQEGDISRRLRFVFAGTFRPERLVAEANSPFNTCERIETSDLTLQDITKLAGDAGLLKPIDAAAAIHDAVGGQPFLIQKLILEAIGENNEVAAIERTVSTLREGAGDHITNLFRKITSDDALASMVATLVDHGKIAIEAGNEDQRYLIVLGLLRRERGSLYFRNRLYAEVAALSAQLVKVETNDAQRAVLFPLDLDAFSKISSTELQEVAHLAQRGAVAAYRSGSNRLALAGFGTAMEAVLIDFLARQSSGDLGKAAGLAKSKGRYFDPADPATWTLADLMRGTRELLGKQDVNIPENLREWRNLIHPGVAVRSYIEDSKLAPEVGVAGLQLQIVLRDLP
nr:AAA-like domain-containing protein [Mesorhizobium sp.]